MVLVTGATGLVGSYLLLSLIKEEKSIVALYRNDLKKNATINFLKKRSLSDLWKNIIWRKADLCNLPSLEKSFESVTHLYHCAALISFAYYNRKKLVEVNHIGTTYIVNLAIKYEIEKIVYVSSTAALGNRTNSNIDEFSLWDSYSSYTPYGYSKLNAELEIWRASQEGVPVIIVNPGIIIGSGVSSSSLDLLCKQVDRGMFFYPKGSAGYVTIEDVVYSLTYLMNSNVKNKRFILVAENWSYKKIITQLVEIRGGKTPKIELKETWLRLFWLLECFLSLFGKKRFMTKALIKSLCRNIKISGDKITKETPLVYSDIKKSLILHSKKKF